MAKSVRISLANKCQLLFGAAVILILTAALTVVGLRMQELVNAGPERRARDFADAWLADQIQLGGAIQPVIDAPVELPPDARLSLSLITREQFAMIAEHDQFLSGALEKFETRPETKQRYKEATDAEDKPYYRYARAIRRSDLENLLGQEPSVDIEDAEAPTLANPLEMVLVINLRDPEARRQRLINQLYIVAAGLVAGLLAIAVFWFITTRIILSPVRVLRDYAGKVSEGDLNIRSDINTGDEFEQLSDVFNTMLENLKKNADELRAANKTLDLKLGELAETNVALYEANKIKGDFLANVSHEFRTPLNSIIGFAEVLQETVRDRTGPIDEKRKRYTANIIQSSRQLLDLINDLLDLAKIEAGRMELNVSPVSVTDTLEGLVNLMRPQAEKQQIDMTLRVDPALPLVRTDPGKLQQVLFNFMSNAIKFTPPEGDVTVEARLVPVSNGDPKYLRISVSDTGPGITADDQEKIFDKFSQLDPSVTREHGGSGLGLTISKELAAILHGRIELDSTPGQGATFSIILPLELEERSTPLMPDLVESSD